MRTPPQAPTTPPSRLKVNPANSPSFSYIMGAKYTKWPQSIAIIIYRLSPKDLNVAHWGAHSLRVMAVNLLHHAQFSSLFIKNCLCCHSDTFQMYLRNTFFVADTHSKTLDLTIPTPSFMDQHPLEPHKIILNAAAA